MPPAIRNLDPVQLPPWTMPLDLHAWPGDDLRNYYYTLALPANWLRFNAFGRRVHRDLLVEAGLDERVPHRACLRVLGVGDVNGCDVAQAVHEAVLRHGGVLDPKSTLVYGEPVHVGRLWEGIYLDDLLIAYRHELEYKVALDGSFIPPTPSDQDPDVLEVKAAEAAYEEAGFDRALRKAFRCEVEFKAWGAEINGVLGKVGAPLETRRQGSWNLASAPKSFSRRSWAWFASSFNFDVSCMGYNIMCSSSCRGSVRINGIGYRIIS